ncbi:MAG: terminase small subunit [Candidatus Omnitrophota bacterium]
MIQKKSIIPYEGLTVMQQRFVDYYDGNGTQAAKKAGYKNPRQMGSENLSKPDIKHALKTREDRRRNGHIADREERQAFWTKILRGKETQPAVVGTDGEGNSIVTEIPPKMTDRLKASELLGKSEADFTDKLGVGGVGDDGELTEIPIVFVNPPKREDEDEAPKQILFEARLPLPSGQV